MAVPSCCLGKGGRRVHSPGYSVARFRALVVRHHADARAKKHSMMLCCLSVISLAMAVIQSHCSRVDVGSSFWLATPEHRRPVQAKRPHTGTDLALRSQLPYGQSRAMAYPG